MCAFNAVDGAPFKPGCIYVAPPDHHLLVSGKRMTLSRGPRENRHRPSVDVLFRSAAKAFGPRAIGIILSGALDDGALGLQTIKSQGGIALVQDPQEAPYSGMPEAAFRYTAVDEVLPVRQIASRLVKWCQSEFEAKLAPNQSALEEIAVRAGMTAQEMAEKLGPPSVFVCPECSGPLWELKNGELVHYQCLTGHSYSPASLIESDGEALERALWIAIRTLEQRASLLRRLSRQTKEAEMGRTADSFDSKALECEEQARVIRQIIERGSEDKARAGKGKVRSAPRSRSKKR
jgi:two-component system chemotaxis response regulator CheB